jgi:hypothetical protein
MAQWKAEVIISGVLSVTEDDLEAMLAVVPGVISHNAGTGELAMVWRFGEGAAVAAAIERASYAWRAALGNASGIEAISPDVMCTDFRVCRAETGEEAEAQLKKIFKD